MLILSHLYFLHNHLQVSIGDLQVAETGENFFPHFIANKPPHKTAFSCGLMRGSMGFKLETLKNAHNKKQDTGVGPASSAWEADILPMY